MELEFWQVVLLTLLGGAGIFSLAQQVIHAVVESRSASERRRYEERREAFTELLRTFQDAVSMGLANRGNPFFYWQARVRIVSSRATADAALELSELLEPGFRKGTTVDWDKVWVAHATLLERMRDDLGIG